MKLTPEELIELEHRFFGYCASGHPRCYWPNDFDRDLALLDEIASAAKPEPEDDEPFPSRPFAPEDEIDA